MNGSTMGTLPLPEIVGKGDNADKVKEVNFSSTYFWMLNNKGRKVPVAPHLEVTMLGRGYVHTDRVLQKDDPLLDVRLNPLETETDPLKALAKIADILAKNQLASTEQLKVLTQVINGGTVAPQEEVEPTEEEEVSFPRKRTKSVKKEEVAPVEETTENNLEEPVESV